VQYLSDDRIFFVLFKMSFSDATLIVEEDSSVLGIKTGVPHLTKFDVEGVQRWGVALMRSVCRG